MRRDVDRVRRLRDGSRNDGKVVKKGLRSKIPGIRRLRDAVTTLSRLFRRGRILTRSDEVLKAKTRELDRKLSGLVTECEQLRATLKNFDHQRRAEFLAAIDVGLPTILMICHNRGGGTERHVRDLGTTLSG